MTRTIIIMIASVAAIAAHADNTDLIEATRANDVAQVELLLDNGADTEGTDEHGHTALHFAAGYGNAEIARMLIEHGADVDAVGRIGNTPLLIAAQEGHTAVARILVDSEAHLDATDEFGGTSLRYAAGRGHRDIADLLRAAVGPEQDSLAGVSIMVAGVALAMAVAPVFGARLLAAIA